MNRTHARTFAALLSLSAALSVAACGGSGALVSTGLPRGAALKDLTMADLKTACVNTLKTQAVSEAAQRGLCAAELLPKGVAACTAGLEACVAAAQAEQTKRIDPAQCDKPMSTDPAIFAGCTATVGEFEDCLSEIIMRSDATYDSVTCSTTTLPSHVDPTSGPACVSMKSKCSGVIDSAPLG